MNETNIVALEIGSSKIRGAYGTVDANGTLTVKAVEEEAASDCVRYGVVSNAEEVAAGTSALLERLEERINGKYIDSVYLGIGGRSFRTDRRECERILPGEMEINTEIIDQLIAETAQTVPPTRYLLDVVPYDYYVDKANVSRPVGMLGSSIRMLSNVITCRPQIKRNLCHLINEKLGLNIVRFIVRQNAIADLTLTAEEKSLGCMLVDFGAETTTVSIYRKGHLQYMETLPLGSRNITRDLMHLNLIEQRAEELKVQFGQASGEIKLPETSGTDTNSAANFIKSRVGEIIANIKEQLKLAGYKNTDLASGVVLVGRGALLNGFNERLSHALDMKVRTGASSRTDIRVTDPHITISQNLDVIATLYEAAKHNPEECLTAPEPEVVTEPQPADPEPEAEPVVAQPAEPELPAKPAKHTPGWFSKVKDRVNQLLSETDDETDDTSMTEDPD